MTALMTRVGSASVRASPHFLSSSSSAFASFKPAVSKPYSIAEVFNRAGKTHYYAAPDSSNDALGREHDLARHASLAKQLVRSSRPSERKSLRDYWLDFLLLKEVKEGDQILSKQCRSQPFEPLDAVGDYPFAAWKKPAARDV
jgi:hypothetical protein